MVLRYSVEPRDVSPEKAARRLGIELARFHELLPRLMSRGFPAPDLDTGNFDLDEIDAWRARRHRRSPLAPAIDDTARIVAERLARM